MSKFYTIFIAVILSIVGMFTGGNPTNVIVEITEPVTTDSEYIYYEATNYSGVSLHKLDEYTLEKKIDDSWVTVEFDEGAGFEDDFPIYRNFSTVSVKINLEYMFGKKLEAGEYRLNVSTMKDQHVSVTFNVTEA